MDLLTFFVVLTVLAVLAPKLWDNEARIGQWFRVHRDALLVAALGGCIAFAVWIGRWGGLW